MAFQLHQADCFEWLPRQRPNSMHAICTDPPYGVVEFSKKEIDKLRNGNRGGVWRMPPKIGGIERDPLPRFTTLNAQDRENIRLYFKRLGEALMPVLAPGGHALVAGNPMLQHLVQTGMGEAGFEIRTAIMRLYRGFRGGDRPKLAEQEFPDVCVTPRGAYEPWMLFRKPISEKTVAQNLRVWGTGGLRRVSSDQPFPDVIQSGRTPALEEAISDHPCLKPQHLMRLLVRSLLPVGEGVVLDPFSGSGSTLAAAEAIGCQSSGVEVDEQYYLQSLITIPKLARLYPHYKGETLEMPEEPLASKVRAPRQTAQALLI